jgi:hypothetical protein
LAPVLSTEVDPWFASEDTGWLLSPFFPICDARSQFAAAARPYPWVCGGGGTRLARALATGAPVLARERLRGLNGEPCHRGSGVILMTVTEGNSRVCTGGVWQR